MTLHVGPARVVHEVEVWKLCGIGGLLPHPHPDESEFFEDRIGPGDRGLRDDPVAVRAEDTLTIRIETQSVVGALELIRVDLSLGQGRETVRAIVTQHQEERKRVEEGQGVVVQANNVSRLYIKKQ